jgi:hypothetical membrane protein
VCACHGVVPDVIIPAMHDAADAPAPAVPRPDRAQRAGALLWVSSIQFFIAQAVVQSAWRTPFSLKQNFISDLGNTACAPYPPGSRTFVCSPWHALMNASFLLLALTIIPGDLLARRAFPPGALARLGRVLVALAGFGYALVGMFPENVNLPPHKLGAAVQFVGGNLGIALLGLAMTRARARLGLAVWFMVSGAAGLVATALLVTGRFLGLGIGGVERIAAYPLPLALILAGSAFAR